MNSSTIFDGKSGAKLVTHATRNRGNPPIPTERTRAITGAPGVTYDTNGVDRAAAKQNPTFQQRGHEAIW
jgi:hypothetical protein